MHDCQYFRCPFPDKVLEMVKGRRRGREEIKLERKEEEEEEEGEGRS